MYTDTQPNLILVVILLAVIALGTAFAAGTTAQSVENPDIVVQEGESIQTAVDEAAPGDTILVREGTYEEQVVVDTRVTLAAEDGVRLDGNDIGSGDGIVVTASDASIEGFEILRFDGSGIAVEAEGVAVVDVRTRLNDESGINAEADLVDGITLDGISAENNGDRGLKATGDIEVTNSTFTDNSGAGASVFDGGSITVTDSTFESNSYGIVSREGSSIDITDASFTNNGNDGIDIRTDAQLGRSITLTNVSTRLNGDLGVDIEGTPDPDTLSIEGGQYSDNDDDGIETEGVETITVEAVTFTDNGGNHLDINSAVDREIEIANVTADRSGFRSSGIDVQDGSGSGSVNVTNTTVRENEENGLFIEEDIVSISETTVDENGDSGIDVTAETISVTDVSAADNDDEGVHIDGASAVTVTDVAGTDNGGSHVDIGGGTDREITIRNVVADRGGGFSDAGVIVRSGSGSGQATIRNVTARANTEHGVSVDESDITLKEITVSENDERGVNVVADTVSIDNVITEENGREAVDISEASTVAITDVTAEGNGRGAIDVGAASTVDITDVIAEDNGGSAVAVGDAGDREITIKNLTANRGGGLSSSGVSIAEGTGSGTVTATNVETIGFSEHGLSIDEDQVTLTNVTANENDEHGINVNGGSFTLQNATVSKNGDEGVYTTDTDTVDIRRVLTEENGDRHIRVKGGNDRNITITNVTSQSNTVELRGGRFGIWVEDGSGDGELTIENVESIDQTNSGLSLSESTITVSEVTASGNDNDGIELDGDQITVESAVTTGNEFAGIRFNSIGESATVTGSSISSNDIGIVNEDDSVEVDARGNWWNNESGPASNAIKGAVDTTEPLSSPPGVTVEVVPESLEIEPGSNTTAEVVVDEADDGVAAFEIELAVDDPSVSEIVAVEPTNDPDFPIVDIADDGSNATASVGMGANVHEGTDPIVLSVELAASGEGTTTLEPTRADVTAIESDRYVVGALTGATVEVANQTVPDPIAGDTPPQDLDGDGTFEDIDGDGELTIFDVQTLFSNLDSDSVQDNAAAYDFSGSGSDEVTVFDVQALFGSA